MFSFCFQLCVYILRCFVSHLSWSRMESAAGGSALAHKSEVPIDRLICTNWLQLICHSFVICCCCCCCYCDIPCNGRVTWAYRCPVGWYKERIPGGQLYPESRVFIVSAYRYIAITQLPIIPVFVEYLAQFLINFNQIYRHGSVPKKTSPCIF